MYIRFWKHLFAFSSDLCQTNQRYICVSQRVVRRGHLLYSWSFLLRSWFSCGLLFCFLLCFVFLKGVGKCFGEITHPNNKENETANFTRIPDWAPSENVQSSQGFIRHKVEDSSTKKYTIILSCDCFNSLLRRYKKTRAYFCSLSS